MSDFLKKAAGLIFNVEDTDEKETPAAKSKPNTSSERSAFTNSAGAQPDSASVEKFRAYFKVLYDKANLSGPDFYEFYNMVEAMGNLISDEIKYPSVFAGFAGQLTKEKLISSANQYINVLQTDRNDFDRSLNEARNLKVQGRKAQIEKKAEEIKTLQERITTLNQEMVALSQQAQSDDARLAAEQTAYYQQSEAFQEKIKSGIAAINQYLK